MHPKKFDTILFFSLFKVFLSFSIFTRPETSRVFFYLFLILVLLSTFIFIPAYVSFSGFS